MADLPTGPDAGMSGTSNGNATGQSDAGQQSGQQAQQNGGDQGKTFTQAELDAIVKTRLEREQRKAQEVADKAKADAEAKALTEQGEFKTLAEQRAAKLAELEPKAGQVDRYAKALQAQVAELRKDLPDHLAPLLDRMDPVDQLEYLVANRAKLVPTATPQAPNINGGGSHAQTAPDPKEREAALRQRFRLGGR